MNARNITARVVAALVGGSGLLNLLSLMGGPVPTEQPAWVLLLFPLDFAGVSRNLTLLSGFVLALVAAHLWASKKRAWQMALLLAAASVVFHLTRGWNIEEALSSAFLLAALWIARRAFVVRSERPRLDIALQRTVFAFTIVAVYGVLGFWLLEPAEFHCNFHWWEAAHRTLRLMLFLDSNLVPHTPYAAWFLDSMLWITGTAIFYSGLVLFRPVAYRFLPDRAQSDRAREIAGRYGRSGQDYFKLGPDKSYFFSPDGQSFLAYRVAGRYALVLGDPVGPHEQLEGTVDAFREYCRARGWRVGFHQVADDSLPVYLSLGFHGLKVGDDAIVDLDRFSLAGSAMKEFRNTVNRLDRLGHRVERIDPPVPDPLLDELNRISDRWLEIPGHRERHFTLGRFDRAYVATTPIYVARDGEGRAVAFLNLVPSFDPELATVDLMRRCPDPVNGLMDYLFAKTFLDLKARGIRTFSLGMAPVSDWTAASSLEERVVCWLFRHAPFLFRNDSLRRFKSKYASVWKPRYAVYQSRFDLPRFGLALRRISERPPEVREAA